MSPEDKVGCGMAIGFWTIFLVALILWSYRHPAPPGPPAVEYPDAHWNELPFQPGAM